MKQINEIQFLPNQDETVLHISGQISLNNYNKKLINETFLNYTIIDLNNLVSVDSVIILFCIQLARFFKKKNKTIQIVGLNIKYKNLFMVYGLDTNVMNLSFNE